METQDRNIVSSAMHGGKPYKSYIKTILGKVFVTVLSEIDGQPEGVILEGDPRRLDDSSIVDVWSVEEDYYFTKKNKRHLTTGALKPYVRKEEEKEKTIEQFSDEELVDIINSKFFTLQSALNSTNSIATLYRIQNLAQELEKSDKIMKAIEARISEIQAEEFKPFPASPVEEL